MKAIFIMLGSYCIWSADQRTVALDDSVRAVISGVKVVAQYDPRYLSTKRWCEHQPKLFFLTKP
jgi:hypothetical protein